MPVFHHSSTIPHPPEVVRDWHMRTGAFERLVPPWIKTRILSWQGDMSSGGRIRLAVRRGPGVLKWELEHTGLEGKMEFRDRQLSGPFGAWSHVHRFQPGPEDGCIMEDEVEWEAPLGAAGRALPRSLVDKELRRLFLFRHDRLRNDLSWLTRYGIGERWSVAVTGASGLIGKDLTYLLRSGGHRVVRLVRDRKRAEAGDAVFWNPGSGVVESEALEGMDAVVHLAGEPISGLRWTTEKKRAIQESRVRSTDLLARTLAELGQPPKVFVCASGVGYYGNRGEGKLTEESAAGKGFLAKVCQEWEMATRHASRAGIRVVNLRTAMVLSRTGGALGTMLLPFQVGIGGRLGSGRQYVSWIDLDDHVGMILHAIATPSLSGPVNATAPHPVPNSTFTSILGRVLGRPTLIPVPGLAVKALFGEMGEALLLHGARVLPDKAQETGFEFRYEGLEDSLRFQLGKPM